MAPSNVKLAAALEALRQLQRAHPLVVRSRELSRTNRDRLVKHGFLTPVIKGWLYVTDPTARSGDTTPWYAAFWRFCARYCESSFGERWHLSPQQSLDLHGERTAVPEQLVLYSPKAQNNRLDLPFDTSLFGLRQQSMPPDVDLEIRDGLRLFGAEAALIKAGQTYLQQRPTEARVVLEGLIDDPSPLLRRLLDGGHSTTAGWLAGAFRDLGRGDVADEIVTTMRQADFDVRERSLKRASSADVAAPRAERRAPPAHPIARRLRQLWAQSRGPALAILDDKTAPLPRLASAEDFSASMEAIYEHDAYHSLSIEGYRITPELVARVASGAWSPEDNAGHRRDEDALAARGYHQAFSELRDLAKATFARDQPQLLRQHHRSWFRELFAPHVAVGLLEAGLLAGYRRHPVFLRGSRHVPPRWEILGDAMAALFDLVEGEPHGVLRAILAHWLLGYIHPFPDGNGRVARFAMNLLLASAGYPWTVIRVERRETYLAALEEASVHGDVSAFALFVSEELRWSAELGR